MGQMDLGGSERSFVEEYYLLRYNALSVEKSFDVAEKHAASIFGLPPAFMPVACISYSTLKMEAICSSEKLVDFQWTTQHYVPQDITLHNHRCENL
jgi:hypothetical protein